MARGERKRARGFTLIEVIIVLAILSVILGMLAPFAFQLFSSEQTGAVENEIQQIHRAIVGDPGNGFFGYVGDVGTYPANLMDLMVQPTDPATGNKRAGWKGPYLQNPRAETGVILDPFGRPFEYLLKAVADGVGNQFAIISRGPDGVSTNTAQNPNIADNLNFGTLPTDPSYTAPQNPQNTDNVVYPKPVNATAHDKIVSGDVALNILNFDANPKVNAFVPACPQLFKITATSVPRGTDDVSDMTYAQGLAVDLFQGQYVLKVVPQGQTTVSWTETVTVLPAATLTRTLNLTGLDSSTTPSFNLKVTNKFSSSTKVEIFQFDTEISGSTNVGGTTNVNDLAGGSTAYYIIKACSQVYIRNKTGQTVLDQFVMPYGDSPRAVGGAAASVTIVNMAEKRLRIFRNNVLVGTIPRGDVHDDEGEKHGHIKKKTFKDWLDGDELNIYVEKKDKTTSLVFGPHKVVAPSETITVQ